MTPRELAWLMEEYAEAENDISKRVGILAAPLYNLAGYRHPGHRAWLPSDFASFPVATGSTLPAGVRPASVILMEMQRAADIIRRSRRG